jgi:PAP2 superfamily
VSFPLLCAVGVLLAMWSFLRKRRLAAAGGTLDGWSAGEAIVDVPRLHAARPGLARLGLNPLGQLLIGLNVVALVAGVACFSAGRLSIEWSTAWPGAAALSALVVVWLNFYYLPGARWEWFVAEVLFVTFVMVLLTNVLVPLQYGALALRAPWADPWLARADAWLGVSVPAMTAWTQLHPSTALAAKVVYSTFAPQMLLTIFALAVLRERDRLWEFAFHFHLCLIVTIAALAIWPAVCPPVFYGFRPTIDMTRVLAQIQGFHDGAMTTVSFNEVEGLVSVPSFHVAGVLLVTWAFRHRRPVFVALIVLNLGLTLSTVVTGVHYAIDVLAALPLVAASIAAYRWGGRRLLASDA